MANDNFAVYPGIVSYGRFAQSFRFLPRPI